jgi:predicted flap endonuclease-1-like 5' DNA nuclease
MIYLIGQLSVWLLLTAAFAAVAGWAFAAERAVPAERALRRERENLLRDVVRLAGGEVETSALEDERETDAMRRQLELRDGRIAELEQSLERARARADEAAGEVAEMQRRIEQMQSAAEGEPLVAAAAEPAPPCEVEALQAWRLRYFEQRVRYLEGQARTQAGAPAQPEPEPEPPIQEWRAREAEARAAYLAQELRAAAAPVAAAPSGEEPPPFAANADVDVLLRWRMLYLERRVAHLQKLAAEAAAQAPAPAAAAAPDPDRWKWRARYLEARVRHLEQRAPQAAPQEAPAPAIECAVVSAPAVPARKPPVLAAARDGAPDDLTLIEGVSPLQQTTLNAMGVFHFDQIAVWTPENVAWVDQYLRLKGRIADEEWVEQAADLARDGPAAARRVAEEAL